MKFYRLPTTPQQNALAVSRPKVINYYGSYLVYDATVKTRVKNAHRGFLNNMRNLITFLKRLSTLVFLKLNAVMRKFGPG